MTIPARLIRTVPNITTAVVDDLWARACGLHPGWEHVDLRDPLDPADFPRTGPHWSRCHHGAQKAGLIRLEELWARGGVYIDSDIHLFRPLDDLIEAEDLDGPMQAFAAREGEWIVPDAVLGAVPGHPIVDRSIDLAIDRLRGRSRETAAPGAGWTIDRGAWSTGPGVITTLWPSDPDVTILPKETFYDVYCDPRDTLAERLAVAIANPHPAALGQHLWAWSWR